MPMPNEYVTNERIEAILLGIAQQIQGGMAEVKPEMTGPIIEAELRWQAQLSTQFEDRGKVPLDGLEDLRTQLAESESQANQKLRAQDAELQQLQQGLRDLEQQARRTTTTTI